MANPTKKKVPFSAVVSALLDESQVFPPSYLHRFSDLTEQDIRELSSSWLQVNPARRLSLMEDLEELAENDMVVSFDALSVFALDDPDPLVRSTAVRLLWENQDLNMVPVYVEMMGKDPDPTVRAAAASALGLFVYLGELEEIPADTLRTVEDELLQTAIGPDQPVVRRRAMEALGYSSRDDVPELIQVAFETGDAEWVSSALFAMGRSADPRWGDSIMQTLHHPDVEVQLEAVRAAGQLELAAARLPLLEMLDEDQEVDDDVVAAAVWSLSQIGGEGVRERLEQIIEEMGDDDDADQIENALENLSFTEDFGVFEMFDFDNEEPEENNGFLGGDEDEDSDSGTSKPGLPPLGV